MAFLSRHRVRFADIDCAGIVYFPRFFDFFHRALEDFFSEDVGLPYHELIDVRRVGLPVVHIESDFKSPLEHGDEVTIELATAHLGGKSIGIRYRAFRPSATDPAGRLDDHPRDDRHGDVPRDPDPRRRQGCVRATPGVTAAGAGGARLR